MKTISVDQLTSVTGGYAPGCRKISKNPPLWAIRGKRLEYTGAEAGNAVFESLEHCHSFNDDL